MSTYDKTYQGKPCRVVRDDGDNYPVIELADGKLQTVHTDEITEPTEPTYTPDQAVEIQSAPGSWERATYVCEAENGYHMVAHGPDGVAYGVHPDKIRPVTGKLSDADLSELHEIATRLYNLARRNGYPSDLKRLYTEALANLSAYGGPSEVRSV